MNYSPPAIDYVAIAPMIVIFGAAIVSVLVEAFTPRSVRRYLQLLIVFGSLIAAAALIVINASTRVVTAGQAIVIDGPALVLQGAIVIIALLGAALMAERSIDSVGDAFASRVSSLPEAVHAARLPANRDLAPDAFRCSRDDAFRHLE